MGIIEELASLRASVEGLSRAVGRHSRVPEQRWATVTTFTATDLRVTFPGTSGEAIITRSTEAVWLGAQVLVQIQGNDRWVIGLGGGGIPAGFEGFTASAAVPSGWLLRDGAAYSRATYWRLFASIGTVYGAGDGSTTFNVPNLLGRVDMGTGTATGWAGVHPLGQVGGEENHALTAGENGPHSHPTYINMALINTRTAGSESYNVDSGGATQTGSSGFGTPHNNLPPYVAGTPIIKF